MHNASPSTRDQSDLSTLKHSRTNRTHWARSFSDVSVVPNGLLPGALPGYYDRDCRRASSTAINIPLWTVNSLRIVAMKSYKSYKRTRIMQAMWKMCWCWLSPAPPFSATWLRWLRLSTRSVHRSTLCELTVLSTPSGYFLCIYFAPIYIGTPYVLRLSIVSTDNVDIGTQHKAVSQCEGCSLHIGKQPCAGKEGHFLASCVLGRLGWSAG